MLTDLTSAELSEKDFGLDAGDGATDGVGDSPLTDLPRTEPPPDLPADAETDLPQADLPQVDSQLDLPQPDLFKPDLFKPDLFKPDLFKPDLFKPDLFKPDLFKPDQSPPDLPPPDARWTCNQLYGFAPNYVACSQTLTHCRFYTHTNSYSCDDICKQGGGQCTASCEEGGSGYCNCDHPDPCSTVAYDQICTCTRP